MMVITLHLPNSSPPQQYDQSQNQATTDKTNKIADNNQEPEISWQMLAHRTITDPVAFFTAVLALLTGTLAVVSIAQGYLLYRAEGISRDSANAAKQAAEIGRQTLIASQRAWIRIDSVYLSGSLSFDKTGVNGTVSFKITNVGTSPATNVTPHVWLFAMKDGEVPVQRQLEMCGPLRNGPFGMGFTLFPNEKFPENAEVPGYGLGISASPDEINKGLATSKDGKHLMLYIVGCIDYTFPIDKDVHHQTGFIRLIERNGPDLLSPDDGVIPANQLIAKDAFLGQGQYAD